jgi:hypothetical protein
MNGLGFGRKYVLEAKLLEREADKTLQYYSVEQFMENDFFKGKSGLIAAKLDKFYQAIEFVSKLKKDASTKNSDLIICFLEAFNINFPSQLKSEHHDSLQ